MEIGMYANIVPPEYGGGGGGASRYARKLADRGHNVTLFTKTESPDNIDKVEIIPIDRKYRVKGKNKLLKLVCFTLLFFNYLKYLWSNNFDVLHCYSASPHSLLFNATAKLVGIPTIVETTLLDSDDPVSVRRLRFGRVRLFLFRLADRVVALSPEIDRRFDKTNFPQKQRLLIPNTVDTKTFCPKSDYTMRKKNLGIKFSKVIISVGILIPRKNQLELINTFRTIKDDFPSTGIVLLGPKSKHHINKKYTKKLENKLTEWGINDRVLMPGMRHDVSDWMSVSDIFMFASTNEGLPFSVIEAMSTGLPCVVKEMDTTTTFIFESGNDGFVYSEPHEAANILTKLLSDEALRQRVGKNARNKVIKKFSDESKMNRYETVYENIVRYNIG